MSLEDKVTRREFLKAVGIITAGSLVGVNFFNTKEVYADRRSNIVDLQVPPPHPVLGRAINLGSACDQGCYAILTIYKGQAQQFFVPSARHLELNYKDDDNVTYSVNYGPRFERCTEAQWQQICGTTGNHIREISERITDGEFCYRQKNFKEAVEHYTIAAIIDPYSQIVNPDSRDPKKPKGLVWEMLAKSYVESKNRKEAVRTLKVGIKFCPEVKILRTRLVMYE